MKNAFVACILPLRRLSNSAIEASVELTMPTLIKLYEEQARGCIELAERLEEPNHRDALLKIARDWMRDAEALRQAASSELTPTRGDDDSFRSARCVSFLFLVLGAMHRLHVVSPPRLKRDRRAACRPDTVKASTSSSPTTNMKPQGPCTEAMKIGSATLPCPHRL
jgi:hypothetical protein